VLEEPNSQLSRKGGSDGHFHCSSRLCGPGNPVCWDHRAAAQEERRVTQGEHKALPEGAILRAERAFRFRMAEEETDRRR
jgi:hypothetical protein